VAQALEYPETRTEASEALRGLIDGIVLTPDQGELRIELKGSLATMLGAAQNAKRSPETGDLSLQVVMVAGPATSGTCSCGAGRRHHRRTMSELRYWAVQESLREERIGRLHEAPHSLQVERQRG
jgi:hypothetical protein